MNIIDRERYPGLGELVDGVLAVWPGHAKALAKSFAKRGDSDLQRAEAMALMILKLAPVVATGLDTLAGDYRFLCENIILPEEIHFRRHGSYRLATFRQALDAVYDDKPFMTRYMNGLLVSCVLWVNHARALGHYAEQLLPHLEPGSRLVEIGPGHGLLLCLACEKRALQVNAWDVSAASLDLTRKAASTLGFGENVRFRQQDIFEIPRSNIAPADQFDAIVLSEVLEHLENPDEALTSLFNLTRPGGRVWINVPVNSPAPDHIYLLRHPDEARDLIAAAGFEIVDQQNFPMNDADIEQAIRQKLTISCAIIARRPAT